MPVKYEKEIKMLRGMNNHYDKENASAFLWSQILLGWETEELRRLLAQSMKTAVAIQAELENLITTLKKRRTQ